MFVKRQWASKTGCKGTIVNKNRRKRGENFHNQGNPTVAGELQRLIPISLMHGKSPAKVQG